VYVCSFINRAELVGLLLLNSRGRLKVSKGWFREQKMEKQRCIGAGVGKDPTCLASFSLVGMLPADHGYWCVTTGQACRYMLRSHFPAAQR